MHICAQKWHTVDDLRVAQTLTCSLYLGSVVWSEGIKCVHRARGAREAPKYHSLIMFVLVIYLQIQSHRPPQLKLWVP